MIISQSRTEVKRKALRLISSVSGLSRPLMKFVLEMTFGILTTGSCNVNQIAGNFKEKVKVKHTLKRLQRMLLKSQLLEFANILSLKESLKKIGKSTILALDGGDISHQYGKKFEKSVTVKDGSSGKLRKGYWLNQISGYNPDSGETYPILLSIYSTLESGFKSANKETFKIADKLVEEIGDLGLWVIDRGYDSGHVLKYFLGKGLDFMVRMKETRNIQYKGKSENIYKRAGNINRRIKFHSKASFGSCKVKLNLGRQEYELTLICYKDKRNKKPMIFLTNGWIKSTKELKRRIRGYFHRWGVEECYRFEKQGFGIEKSKLRSYDRIKTMLGLSIISWLILIRINEQPVLKEVVLQEARMEKDREKDRPKFIYYRLLRGIQNIFAGQRLFLFRLKRKERESVREKIFQQMPLFRTIILKRGQMDDISWIEEVA
jgi:hypothetical protein